MALKFVSITQPTEDSEEVGVSFQLDSEYTGKPPTSSGKHRCLFLYPKPSK